MQPDLQIPRSPSASIVAIITGLGVALRNVDNSPILAAGLLTSLLGTLGLRLSRSRPLIAVLAGRLEARPDLLGPPTRIDLQAFSSFHFRETYNQLVLVRANYTEETVNVAGLSKRNRELLFVALAKHLPRRAAA